MSLRRRIEVSAGVVCADGRMLIAQRRPGDHLALFWEFPGGKREPGESWEACLRRELLEEIGVEVVVGAWLDAVTHEYADRDVSLRFFRCRLLRGTPSPLHCHDVRWVEPHELASFEFPEADAGLVRWLAGSIEARRDPARVTFTGRGGDRAGGIADVPMGTRLIEAAARCRIASRPECGSGECGACAVSVIAGARNLSPRTAQERRYFVSDSRRALARPAQENARRATHPRRRLACQTRVLGDVTIACEEVALLHV